VVTHQLQVERRTGKVRQSQTDVQPLCYATNPRGEFQTKKNFKNNFPVTNNADIVLSPARNLQVITIHGYLCCMGVLCTWVKLLTDLQILCRELHKNAFGGWGPAGGAIALRRHPTVIRGGKGGNQKERVSNREGRKGGREGREGIVRNGKEREGWVEGKSGRGREGKKREGGSDRNWRGDIVSPLSVRHLLVLDFGATSSLLYYRRSSRVVSASDCGVRRPRFESHRGRLCLSRQPLRYTALSTGCAPLLQCLGRLNLPPSVER